MNDNNDNNEEELEKKKQKKKKRIILIIVVLVSVSAEIGLFMHTRKTPKKEKVDPYVNHEQIEKYKDSIKDTKVIEKLLKIVDAGTFNDYGYKGLAYDFAKGINGLNDEQKIRLALQIIINTQDTAEKINEENIPEKYKDDEIIGNINSNVIMLSSRVFEKEYKKIFGEDPKYNEETIKKIDFCPKAYKVDLRIKKMFFINECEKDGDTILVAYTNNYKFDDDYYYVYQRVVLIKKTETEDGEKETFMKIKNNEVIEVDDFYKGLNQFETLVWKFDKNYNFISTTLES